MAKTRRRGARKEAAVPGAPPDYGPPERRGRGEVEVVDAPDPERPSATIRRAQVVVIYHALWARGRLSDAQHEAADRLSVLSEAASGASAGDGGGGRAHWERTMLSERALQAVMVLAGARAELGEADYCFTHAVCALNRWPDSGGDVPRLARCLDRLARRWGMA